MKNECVCYYLDLFRVTCSEHSFSGNVDLERLSLACVTEADLLKAANRASTSGHRWPPAQAGRGAMTPIACRPLRCHAGRSKSTRVTPARPCCSAGFFDRSTAIEGRSDSFPVSEIDQSFHLKRGPTERPSAANDDLRCTKGFSKQFGNNRSHRTAFPLVESLDLSQNGVVDIQCRLHDACLDIRCHTATPKRCAFGSIAIALQPPPCFAWKLRSGRTIGRWLSEP